MAQVKNQLNLIEWNLAGMYVTFLLMFLQIFNRNCTVQLVEKKDLELVLESLVQVISSFEKVDTLFYCINRIVSQ